MKYMLLIYEDERVYGAHKASAASQEIIAKHMAFTKEIGATRVSGAGLQPTSAATTVRTAAGEKSVHDGPFAETKEQLGGYYLIDVPSLEAAIDVARKLPVLRDGSVEIRPLLGGG